MFVPICARPSGNNVLRWYLSCTNTGKDSCQRPLELHHDTHAGCLKAAAPSCSAAMVGGNLLVVIMLVHD
jgi:hypothetical protein